MASRHTSRDIGSCRVEEADVTFHCSKTARAVLPSTMTDGTETLCSPLVAFSVISPLGPVRRAWPSNSVHRRGGLEFPELRMICGHIGYPWTLEMIAVATKHANVFNDTSAYKAKRYPVELVQYLNKNCRKKVLFGTNYPMITAAQCLRGLDELITDDQVKELFLRRNAERVFRHKASEIE